MDYTSEWSYVGLPPQRSDHLRGCPPYCELIRQIAEKIGNVDIRLCLDEGRYLPVNGALRPLFYADVGLRLADWFFNGVSGYRAQYYASPAKGLKANRYAFGQFEGHLLLAARKADFRARDPNDSTRTLVMPEPDLLASLRLASAKIWGDETEWELQTVTTQKQDATAQIVAHRWVENAEAGADMAKKGIKAPLFRTLKFHGAFLKDGVEQVPLGKMSRSNDIFFLGFS